VRPNSGHKFGSAERLSKVVIGARLESKNLLCLIVPSSQDENGTKKSTFPDPPAFLPAIDARETDVQQDQPDGLVPESRKCLVAVSSASNSKTLGSERRREPPPGNAPIILNDQDSSSPRLHRLLIV
jgi:hypothetical protein